MPPIVVSTGTHKEGIKRKGEFSFGSVVAANGNTAATGKIALLESDKLCAGVKHRR
jgi:hypothetical protein